MTSKGMCFTMYFYVVYMFYRNVAAMPFYVRGHETCIDAWKAAYGINNKSVDDAMKSFVSGVVTLDPDTHVSTVDQSPKTKIAKAWIRLFDNRI